MLAATNIGEYTQFAKFAKYNSTPKFADLQYLGDKQTEQNRKSTKFYCRRELSSITSLAKGGYGYGSIGLSDFVCLLVRSLLKMLLMEFYGVVRGGTRKN